MNAAGPPAEVAIVGGGVMGCALAYYLSKDGVRVTLLEQGAIGGLPSASGASGAIVDFSVGDVDLGRQAVLTHTLLPELAEDLLARTGIDVQLTQPGLLRLPAGDGAVADLRAVIGRYAALGQHAEWLDAAAAQEAQPGLSPDVAGAVYCPGTKSVYAPHYVRALAAGAAAYGADVRQGVPVTALRRSGDRVTAVVTPEGTVEAGHVVLATGAWTGRVSAWLDLDVPIGPQRGQIMALQPRPPMAPVRHMLVQGDGIVAPKANGTVVVGSTRELVGWDSRITAGGIEFLLDTARRTLPPLMQATVKHVWHGFRPMRLDGGRPLVGPLPGLANLGVVAGHGAVGIMLSAGVGYLAAQWLQGRQPDLSLAPFDPALNGIAGP